MAQPIRYQINYGGPEEMAVECGECGAEIAGTSDCWLVHKGDPKDRNYDWWFLCYECKPREGVL